MTAFPDADQCQDIHHRLVNGDRTASARLIQAMDAPLLAWLRARGRTRDPELIRDAATDALVDYIKKPAQWIPEKATLPSYLCMAADRDLLNALDRRQRVRAREVLLSDVEVEAADRNVIPEDDDQSDELAALLRAVDRHLTSQIDKEFLTLILKGERSTLVFARVLGIQQQPVGDQARAVKRHKDRLKKVVQRLRERLNARD